VKLDAEPVFKPARDVTSTMRSNTSPDTNPAAASPTSSSDSTPAPLSIARYHYRIIPKATPGDRAAAERALAQGVQAHENRRLDDEVAAYRQAAQFDASFFKAAYNLGLAASDQGNLPLALTAYENALALRPDSMDGRYNFALVLKRANYPLDAATELEKILSTSPNDSRTHLALGNLYAGPLRQPARARPHYLKVLDTDPLNPEAEKIRFWLTDKTH
jgi:tetratricopeptide (TPR) repeat protein